MGRKPIFSRSDGVYLKNIDPLTRFLPFIMKGRNESAVYFKLQVDATELREYLLEKNREAAASGTGHKATIFHAVLAASVKSAVERPHVNRFIIGKRLYQRKDFTVAYVIKSEFNDQASEELAIMKFGKDDTIQTISNRISAENRKVRHNVKENAQKRHGAVNWLQYFLSLPRFLLNGFVRFLGWLDYHGWLPKAVIEADPMHTSMFLSNLGSLHIDAPFHHLYEWGTTPIFLTVGVISKVPMVMPDKTIAIREVFNLGVTADERICDGFYFAKTMKRFQYFLEHPRELEKPSVPPEH